MSAVSLAGVAVVGFASAFQPFTPVEAYLVGVMATTGAHPMQAGIAAAVGQTAGKMVVFLAARGLLRGELLRRLVDRTGRPARPSAFRDRMAAVMRLLDQPRWSAVLLFATAVTGIPPLFAATVYVARTAMSLPLFLALCVTGRTVRFVAIAFAPALVLPA